MATIHEFDLLLDRIKPPDGVSSLTHGYLGRFVDCLRTLYAAREQEFDSLFISTSHNSLCIEPKLSDQLTVRLQLIPVGSADVIRLELHYSYSSNGILNILKHKVFVPPNDLLEYFDRFLTKFKTLNALQGAPASIGA